MAIIKSLPATKSLSNQLNYLAKEGKTIEELKEGINCTTDNVEQEFNIIKLMYNKTEGKQYYHYTQAFSHEDNITPQKAHELGKEWINNNIKGHQVYMVTHIDKKHIHNHFVINSVNIDNGLKLQISPSKLFEMKKDSNRICERENLAKINLEWDKGISKTDAEYRLEKKGITPWKDELRQCIDFGRSHAHSIEELKEYLKEHFNIEVRETKNSISYKHPEQNKSVRGNKLGGSYTKEGLVNEFNVREFKPNERRRREDITGGYHGNANTNRDELENSIIFGRNEVPGIGNVEHVKSCKKDIREIGDREEPTKGAIREGEEATRENQYREHREPNKDNTRTTNGNESLKGNEFSENRGDSSSSWTVSAFDRTDIDELSKHIERSEEYKRIEDMEGQGITVHNSTRSDSRDNLNSDGCLSSGSELFDKIAKQFDEEPEQSPNEDIKEIDIVAQMLAKSPEELKIYQDKKEKGEFKARESKDIDFDI